MRSRKKSRSFWKLMKRNTQQPNTYGGHIKGNPEREVHSGTGLPKKERNISNEQPNTTSTRTGGTTTNKTQSGQKEGNNKIRAELKI